MNVGLELDVYNRYVELKCQKMSLVCVVLNHLSTLAIQIKAGMQEGMQTDKVAQH